MTMITKASLQAYRDQLQNQLDLVYAMLDNFNRLAGVPSDTLDLGAPSGTGLRAVPSTSQQVFTIPASGTKQPRVRGVLAAVREIVDDLTGPFDKNDIMAKLREKDSEFAAIVTTANLRNTLRLLSKTGEIEVQVDATSKSCAKYVRKRAAA
jgi:hypothetical protein